MERENVVLKNEKYIYIYIYRERERERETVCDGYYGQCVVVVGRRVS